MTRATCGVHGEPRTGGGSPLRVSAHPPPLADNPYQRLLYEHLAAHGVELVDEPSLRRGVMRFSWLWRARGELDLLHVHWPQGLYHHKRGPAALRPALSWVKLAALVPRLAAARVLGLRLVWTVHQVLPHEGGSRRDRLAARLLARACDALIVHDADALAALRDVSPRAAGRARLVPHGSYIGVYPPGRSRAEVREQLGLAPDAFVFLAFGLVRAYKALPALLDAFAAADLPAAALVVAGRPSDAEASALVSAAAARDPRVVAMLRFVPDDEVAELFGAADAAVVARAGGTSGALVLALSLGLPAVAAATAGYADLLHGERCGWLFSPGYGGGLRSALERAAADPEAARHKGRAALEVAATLRWQDCAANTAAIFDSTAQITDRSMLTASPLRAAAQEVTGQ